MRVENLRARTPPANRRLRRPRARGFAVRGRVRVERPVPRVLSPIRARRLRQPREVLARLRELRVGVAHLRLGEMGSRRRRLRRRLRLLRRHRQLAHHLRRGVELVLDVRPDLRGDDPGALRFVRRRRRVQLGDGVAKAPRIRLRRVEPSLRRADPRSSRRIPRDPREHHDDDAGHREDHGAGREGHHQLAPAHPPSRRG
mmetsp:Transcript_5870/g.24263  ORF Transcript_5870/g.24263 Transcript_5870/m.24263 type:complete len:200 (-) Transcript_5870:447-1046(-)